MVEHILAAVDGSAASRKAARFALMLADQTHAKVTLLAVLAPAEVIPIGPLSGYAVTTAPRTEAEVSKVNELLHEIAKERPEVRVTPVVEVGPVAETIIDYAASNKADLIVMGARGHGPARRFLLGSTSDRVVHHAHCPVTVWR